MSGIEGDSDSVHTGIGGGDSDAELAPPPPRRRRRPCVAGPYRLYIVLASLAGWWPTLYPSIGYGIIGDQRAITSIVTARWELFTLQQAADHPQASFFVKAASATQGVPFGYVAYVVDKTIELNPTVAESDQPHHLFQQCIRTPSCNVDDVADCLEAWFGEGLPRAVLPCFLASGLAGRVASGASTILHVVALTNRIARKRLFGGQPSLSKIKAFRSQLPIQVDPVRPKRGLGMQRYSAHSQSIPVDAMLELIRASREVKEVRKIARAATSFARVLSRGGPESAGAMIARSGHINSEAVRKARVRFDVVAMLMFRHFYRSFQTDEINVFLFCDSSPQHKGLELFASTLDLIHPCYVTRKLMPLVVPVGMDAFSKCVTLLYQMFLMVGPSIMAVRHFCGRVRAICSDMGAERLIVDQPDMIKDFYWFMGCKLSYESLPDLTHLFPRALQQPGWKHLWDNCIQRSLGSLPWFPSWLDKFKVFIRCEGVILNLSKHILIFR